MWRTRFEISCICLHFKNAWLTNSQDDLLKTPLVSTKLLLLTQHDNGKGINAVKIFIFPFVLRLKLGFTIAEHEIYISTSNNSPKIFLYYFTFYKRICLFSSLFGDCDVDFWLEANSAQVNLVYLSIFSILIFRMFSAFKKFYLILTFRFTPRFVVKNITFGSRSRYRKIPPAAVANQIAAKARIPPAQVRKKKKIFCICHQPVFGVPIITRQNAVINYYRNEHYCN